MSSAAAKTHFTLEEYFALERTSPIRHEYYNGSIFAMAGASREHNLIALNLGGELRTNLRGRPCETYVSHMRILIVRTGLYTYPDVVVVCGERQLQKDEMDTLLNPTVLFEVLSPTTEAYDRGKRSAHYRRLESLREYVLVAQDEIHVERYTRQGDEWLLTELSDIEDELRLPSIDCTVALREIYARLEFPEAVAT